MDSPPLCFHHYLMMECSPSDHFTPNLPSRLLSAPSPQRGRRWTARRERPVPGGRRRLRSGPGDSRLGHQPRPIRQPALQPRSPAGTSEAPSAKAAALAVHPAQAGRGGGHQAVALALRELRALRRPPGQTGTLKLGGIFSAGRKANVLVGFRSLRQPVLNSLRAAQFGSGGFFFPQNKKKQICGRFRNTLPE